MKHLIFLCTLIVCGLNLSAQSQVEFNSLAAEDGHIAASGTVDNTGPHILVGDGTDDASIRGFLAFDTGSLPDDAVITGARLTLHRASMIGDPASLETLWIDVQAGTFGSTAAFEAEDFNAPASAFRIAPLKQDTVSVAILDAIGRAAVNLTGITSFRLAVGSATNTNAAADQWAFFDGSHADPNLRPKLEITYTLAEPNTPEVTITLDPATVLDAQASRTVTGTVTPTDAHVLVNGTFLDTDSSGIFTYNANLHQGVNALMFRARAYDYLESSAKLDLYLDNEAPVISITAPDNNSYTNQSTIDIYGLVQDTYDHNVALQRDGVEVPLEQGRFVERDLPLSPGENTFTFDAVDNSGNTATPVVLIVHHNNQEPTITLNHPQHLAPGAMYTVDIDIAPVDDVAMLRVTIDNELVHDGVAATFTQSFTHDGTSGAIPIQVSVRDVYGNIAEKESTISVATSRYLSGRVLDHATSHPVENLNVSLVSPYETVTLTTNEQGLYEGYIKGHPVDVQIDESSWVAAQRRPFASSDAHRIPDIRLTERQAIATGPFDLGTFSASFTGGPIAATALDAQALPSLLPLGYSPVIALEIQGAGSAGTLTFDANDLPQFPAGGQLVLLRQQAHQWLVEGLPTSIAGSLQADFNNASDGVYLVAIIDPWSTEPVPSIGDLIARQSDYLLTVSDLTQVLTNPASVSITDDPSTTFFMKVNGQIPSGGRALVNVSEHHQRFDGSLRVPSYELDIMAYHYPEPEGTGLLAALPLTSREIVNPSITRDARITFQTSADQPFDGAFPNNQIINLGALTIDFSAWTQPLVARGHAVIADDLPVALGSEEVISFELWLGGQLANAPQLRLNRAAGGGVVLLRHQDNRWTYAGQLTHDGNLWTNDPSITDLLTSGRYALVAFPAGIVEILGSVRDGGVGQSGVRLSSEDHPYAGLTTTDGQYRFFLNQSDQPTVINAYAPSSRRQGSRTVARTAVATSITGQDIDLQANAFSLLEHQPGADAKFVSRNPDIRLTFNMPLSTDGANHLANISLTSDANVSIPLEILPDYRNNQLNVLAKQTLLPATTYTLAISTGLQNLQGDGLAQATSFSFGTLDENATGDLDLARFFLTEENGQLYVNAPADAYPDTTSLSALNMSTADGWTRQLSNSADFKEPISGLTGDLIDLEATTPDGTVTRLQIDLVQTAPSTWRFGTRPFAVKISDQFTLRVSEVTHGSGKEVTITPVDSATLTAAADQVEYLQELGNYTIQPGINMTVPQGETLPVIQGHLSVVVPNTPDLQILSFLAIQEDEPFPIDPETPDQLVNVNLAEIGAPIPVELGQVQSKSERLKARGKVNLVELNLEIQAQAFWWREDLKITYVLYPAHPEMIFGTVRGYFDGAPINVPGLPYPMPVNYVWNAAIFGSFPVPKAPIFRSTETGYHPMGFTSASSPFAGQFSYSGKYWRPSFYVLNPYTGELVYAVNFESGRLPFGPVLDSIGLSSNAAFDPQYKQDIPFPLADPNNLSVKWEIGQLDEGNFSPDNEATRTLQRRNLASVSTTQSIRATLTIGDATYWDKVRVSGSIAEVIKLPKGNRFVFDFPSDIMASPAKHFFNFEIMKGDEVWQGPKTHITVIDPNIDPSSLGGPPQVLAASLKDGAVDINPLLGEIALEFNEDVKGWDSISITGPTPVAFDLIGSDNLTFEGDDYRRLGKLALKAPLQYGGSYVLTVDGVIDRNGEIINQTGATQPEPFIIRFNIVNQPRPMIPPDREFLGTARGPMDILRHGNRFIVYSRHSNHNVIDTWEVVSDQSIRLEHSNASTGFNLQNPYLSLFTPSDQDLQGATLANQSFRFPAADRPMPIPSDSVLLLRGFNYYNGEDGTSSTLMNRYDFNGNEFLYQMAFSLPLQGSINAEARIGHYMALGTRNLLGETPTLVLDMRRLLIREAELRSRIGTALGSSELAVQSGAITGDEDDSYRARHYRRDVWRGMGAFIDQGSVDDLASAWLADQDGAVKPYLFTSGPQGLRMYAFTPSTLPILNEPYNFALPFSGSDSKRYLDVVPDFLFTDANTNQRRKEHLLIVFQYQGHNQGGLSVITIPRNGSQPEVLFQAAAKGRYLATDPERGLLFLQSNKIEGWFYDLRAMLEHPTSSMETPGAYTLHQTPMQTAFNARMHLEGGYLYGIEAGGDNFKASIYPVDVPIYRNRGFLYADLTPLKQAPPEERSAESKEAANGFSLKHSAGAILHAYDQPNSQNDAEFVMELGVYEIEVEPNETLEITLFDSSGNALAEPMVRDEIETRNLESYALAPTLVDFYAPPQQNDLRAKGYHAFTIQVRIFKDNLLLFEETDNFMVVFQNHKTQYVDGYRDLGLIDGLTRMPKVGAVHHALSARDPRMDLSPGHVYEQSFPFQPGGYGTGMPDTQLLHLGMMSLFSPDAFNPNTWHEGEAANTHIFQTMPGKFMVEGRLNPEEQSIDILNQPRTTLKQEYGTWVMNHLEEVRYVWESGEDFPNYQKIFKSINAHLKDLDDATERMRYPLLRFRGNSLAPAPLLQPVALKHVEDAPWSNKMLFHNDEGNPSALPSRIIESTADTRQWRTIKRIFSSSILGPLTLQNHMVDDGVVFDYSYDADGYLLEITRDKESFLNFEWEALDHDLSLGSFTPKRLRSVQRGNETTSYRYENGSLRVERVTTPYGVKPVQYTAGQLGLPESTALTGVGGAPDRSVRFNRVQGYDLSNGFGSGSEQFQLTWTMAPTEAPLELPVLEKNSWLDQEMTYNADGLLTKHQRYLASANGEAQTWTYDNDGPFWREPTSIEQPNGIRFSVVTQLDKRTTSHADGKLVDWFSPSGVVRATTSLEGYTSGSTSTQFYAPHGSSVDGDGRYSSSLGRIKTTPFQAANGSFPATEFTYDAYGRITRSVNMGAATQIESFDDLDRPTRRRELGGVTFDISYAYDSGYLVITEVSDTGELFESKTDEAGRLVSYLHTRDDQSRFLSYAYDDLGELLEIKEDGQPITSIQIHTSYRVPEVMTYHDPVDGKDQVVTYQFTGGWSPKITGITTTIGDLSDVRTVQTDVLGRTIQADVPDLGLSTFTYDAFGRIKLIAGNRTLTYNYDGKAVTITDSEDDLTVETYNENSESTLRFVTMSGPSVGPNSITRVTAIEVDDKLGDRGYVFHEWNSSTEPGSVKKKVSYNIHGDYMGQEYGKYSEQATGTEARFGRPTGFNGSWGASTRSYDQHGFLNGVSKRGQSITNVSRDIYGQMASFTNARDQSVVIDRDRDVVQSVAIDGKELYTRQDPLKSQQQTWLGASRGSETLALGSQYQVTRDQKTTQISLDKQTGRLEKVVDYDGEQYQTSYDTTGRHILATKADNVAYATEYVHDAFGDLRFIRQEGHDLPEWGLIRDHERRPKEMRYRDRLVTFHYEEEDLAAIKTTGAPTLFFKDYNDRGRAETMEIGDQGSIKAEYDNFGNLRCLTAVPKSGFAANVHFNAFGDITELRQGLSDVTTYEYNGWATPQTMTHNGLPYALMGTNDPLNLNFPGAMEGTLDIEGRLRTLTLPGIGSQQFSYDHNDRLVQAQFGNQTVTKTYHYEQDLLGSVTTTDMNGTQTHGFSYDYWDRLKGMVLNGQHVSYFQYWDEPDLGDISGNDSTDVEGGQLFRDGIANRGKRSNIQIPEQNASLAFMDTPSRDRLRNYVDPNNVKYTYDYDQHGRLKRIDLSGQKPITFEYAYDAQGNLTSIRQGEMNAVFSGYQNGIPASMNWISPLVSQQFRIDDENGRLKRVESTDSTFLLELTWDAGSDPTCNDQGVLSQPLISNILRKGPNFKEVLTPGYGADDRLTSIRIDSNDGQQIIEETYGSAVNQLMPGLRRELIKIVNGEEQRTTLIDYQNQIDGGADNRRTVAALSQIDADHSFAYQYDPNLGNLEVITYALGQNGTSDHQFYYNADRRIIGTDTSVTQGTTTLVNRIDYTYDHQYRRVGYTSYVMQDIVYAWQGSRVIAIGKKHGGKITWTHTIGYGPLGPVFIQDLIGTNSYFIFADQVGTPFAYRHINSNAVYYTSFNPWGELLNDTPEQLVQAQDTVPLYTLDDLQPNPTSLFDLPKDTFFPTSPLGLSGHLYDHETGLVYMHNRYYHPRLGHFLTPDFRAPDIYDPTTFTEPYAFASGNPIMYWDPNGLSGWFFDGTWNNALKATYEEQTNVAKLYALYDGHKEYAPGVGTGFGIKEDRKFWRLLDNKIGGLTGFGGEAILEHMWNLFENYYRSQIFRFLEDREDYDLDIDLFGFSRGASLARTFANMINERGIDFMYEGKKYNFVPNIRLLGVYDTVGSFGLPGNDKEFDFVNLTTPWNVRYVRHLIAEDEFRSGFPVTLVWDGHEEVMVKKLPRIVESTQRGAHADVGGGGNEMLSRIGLRWMHEQGTAIGVKFKEIRGVQTLEAHPKSYEEFISDSMEKWFYALDRRAKRKNKGVPLPRTIFAPNVELYKYRRPYRRSIFSENDTLLDLYIQSDGKAGLGF